MLNNEENKAGNIQKMFNDISKKYDLLNSIISFRRDTVWRKKAAVQIKPEKDDTILDIACGTGDMINALKRREPDCHIIGADFSINMLKICKTKTDIPLICADACSIPFKSNFFDKITMVFGFRNVIDKQTALEEFYRILKPGGTIAILEFSKPKSKLFSVLYWFYFKLILPSAGKILSGHKNAYKYLPKSVENFPKEDVYIKMVSNAGFKDIGIKKYDLGICSLLKARKLIIDPTS